MTTLQTDSSVHSPPGAPSARARPRLRFRVTREGWGWLATAGMILGTGLYKGINLITLLGYLMLLLWGLNAVLASRPLRRFHCRRWVEDAVFARNPIPLLVQVNPAKHLVGGVRIEDVGAEHSLSWFIGPGKHAAPLQLQAVIEASKRGWYALQPLRAVSGYPFGLVERRLESTPAQSILIYPRLGTLSRGRLRRFLARSSPARGQVRQAARRHFGARSEFHGLRDFRSGDSPRWIHWRTSARRGSLMVREFEDLPSDNLILVLDPWLPAEVNTPALVVERFSQSHEEPMIDDIGWNPLLEEVTIDVVDRDAPPEEPMNAAQRSTRAHQLLESAISLTATICQEWCRQKGDRLLLALAGSAPPLILDGITGAGHARLLLECLALVRGCSEDDPEPLLSRLDATLLPPAPVLLVSTRAGKLGDLLEQRWRRPVACLNVADLAEYDFYEERRR